MISQRAYAPSVYKWNKKEQETFIEYLVICVTEYN